MQSLLQNLLGGSAGQHMQGGAECSPKRGGTATERDRGTCLVGSIFEASASMFETYLVYLRCSRDSTSVCHCLSILVVIHHG